MFSTPGARILKFLISRGGGRGGWSGDGRGRMDGEQSNVYGFTKHPSCNHPPTAIPYFAVDIAVPRCTCTCIYMLSTRCVYVNDAGVYMQEKTPHGVCYIIVSRYFFFFYFVKIDSLLFLITEDSTGCLDVECMGFLGVFMDKIGW